MKLKLKHARLPIESLDISVTGHVKANIIFDFDAKVIIVAEFKKLLEDSNRQNPNHGLDQALDFLSTLNIDQGTSPASAVLPSIQSIRSVDIPPAVLLSIHQMQEMDVKINGSLKMQNNSDKPITARIFAQTLVVDEKDNQLQVIDPEHLFIGHYTEGVNRSALGGQFIVPINGTQVNISKIPT